MHVMCWGSMISALIAKLFIDTPLGLMYVKLYLLITSGECNEVSDNNKQSSARQCAGG